jgi:hypothetical protein
LFRRHCSTGTGLLADWQLSGVKVGLADVRNRPFKRHLSTNIRRLAVKPGMSPHARTRHSEDRQPAGGKANPRERGVAQRAVEREKAVHAERLDRWMRGIR